MFEAFGYLMKAWIYLWMAIIGVIPNAFMGGLTLCIVATIITYLHKKPF
jgi:hypothetical protein